MAVEDMASWYLLAPDLGEPRFCRDVERRAAKSTRLPKLAAAWIVVRDHDGRALETGASQTFQAFSHQPFSKPAALAFRINRQMINVSAAPIMTA